MFRRLSAPSFLAHVTEQGAAFKRALDTLATRYPGVIHSVRGVGLILGLQLHETHATANFVDTARARGLLVVSAGLNVIRILPPLVIRAAEVEEACALLDAVCAQLSGGKR